MPSRHRSRHRAVQVLYQCDMRDLPTEEAIRAFYESLYSEENETQPEKDEFMESLVYGTVGRIPEIDKHIQQHSEHWRMERMPAVDRNILRLAVYEMLDRKIEAPIIIDEALDLARRFSGDESVAFLNGVLDAVRKELAVVAPRNTEP